MAEGRSEGDISVIIPTRNRAERLARAIQSVRDQTRPPREIVVVDDASTDATPAYLAALEGEHGTPEVRVIRCAERRGASHARNLGIQAARGDLLGFLDDDDRWLPRKLEVQAAALASLPREVGLVCCAYRVVCDGTGQTARTWHPPEEAMDQRYFLRTTGFMTTVPLLRRTCFERAGGFDESLSGGQDLDMWIRIAEHFGVASVPQVLAEHRIHGHQITTDLPAKARASSAILTKHRERLAATPKLLLRHLRRAAYLHCAAGLPEPGRDYLRQAIEIEIDPEPLRAHLEASLRDPEAHARDLIDSVFPKVGGIRLYY